MSSQNYNLNDLTASQPKSKIWPALVKLVGCCRRSGAS
jgi:hypothetical protein